MAVWERQATSVELCTIQMSTEPPERDTHMETEIKTQTETCLYVGRGRFSVSKTSRCVCANLLLLVLRGRALQLSLAPDWLLTVRRVVHSRGSIRV